MRHHSRVTAISWIPSEAVSGASGKAAFATVLHYDQPLPRTIDGGDTAAQAAALDAWRDADRFRFANQLAAWIEVEGDAIVGAGYDGGGRIGSTTLAVGSHGVTFEATAMPLLQSEPEVGEDAEGPWVRFTQTWGGRTGVPAPRRVNRPPFVQVQAPLAWSTLVLTIHSDGRAGYEVIGASRFPRHWIYDAAGELVAKTGSTDYKEWWRHAFGRHTPWGDTDTPAFITAAETALEQQLSATIMRGAEADDPPARHTARCSPSKVWRTHRSTSCSTECWRSRSTVASSPRSARAPSSASGRCSRAGCELRHCGLSPHAASPSPTPMRSTGPHWWS